MKKKIKLRSNSMFLGKIRNLSVALLLSLAFISVNTEPAEAVALESILKGDNDLKSYRTNVLSEYKVSRAIENEVEKSEQYKILNLPEITKPHDPTVKPISLTPITLKDLTLKITSGITPTLDKLHSQNPTLYPETSAYTLTVTTQTSGDDVYLIDDKYYKMNIKEGINSNTRLSNTADHSATTYTGHYIRLQRSGNANYTGSAIYNNGASAKLGNVIGDFISNGAYATGASKYSYGGALYNSKGTIGNITGDFIGNYAQSEQAHVIGGAIYNNAGVLGNLTGNFIGNTLTAGTYGYGGAIYNNGATAQIGDITGDFISNLINAQTAAYGGAIYNTSGTLGALNGNFSGNSAISVTSTVYGGAIYNTGATAQIGDITGDFTNNSINAPKAAYGGAIYNTATLGALNGNFSGNSATSTTSTAYGGAIYNNGTTAKIEDITGDFISNLINAQTTANGGAIYNNNGTLGALSGNFSGNGATSSTAAANGGAIYNNGTTAQIGDITGDFTNNSINAQTAANGGAIYNNNGALGSLNGNFSGNSVTSATSNAYGGAIYNNGATAQIGDIAGDFTGNSINAQTAANGGAIYNANGTLGALNGNFSGNSVTSATSSANGGAIYNSGATGQIGDITGEFINNYINSEKAAFGSAILNYSKLGVLSGNFINNSAISQSSDSMGAIGNNGTIEEIIGDFVGNSAVANTYAYGGAIYNFGGAIIGDITGNFINNSTIGKIESTGAAIRNIGTIGDVTGNFEGNYVISEIRNARGAAIYNRGNGIIGDVTGNFINNNITSGGESTGGAIYNSATIENITGDFIANAATGGTFAFGGAMCNSFGMLGDVSGNFINNSAKSTSDSYLALGGAIFHTGDVNNLNLVADNQDIVFDGNYTEDYRGRISNAIFVRTNDYTSLKDENNIIIGYEYETVIPKITLNATNGGQFILNDNIDGGEVLFDDIYDGTNHGQHLERNHQYDLEIKGDSTGVVYLNNDILNANITHEGVTTNVGDWTYLSHTQGEGINSLTMTSGVMNIPYLTTEPVTLKSFNMNGGTINLDRVDVDLQGIKMGRFLADDYSGGGGTINVNSLNLLNATDRMKTQILFADSSFADAVNYNGESPIAYSPIYIYDVSYDQLANGGYFTFVRHGIGDKSGSFNPAVLVTPVTNEVSAMSTLNQTFEYAFEHSDIFMNLPELERYSQLTENRYALSTDYNENLGSLNYEEHNKGVWVKPYTAFESIPLKHGPKVDSISYGTLIGGDSDIINIGRGWSNVGTLYVGYNGAQLDYGGVDTTTNGGLLGITETFYKNNFFTAITAATGAGFAESHTMYGKEDTTFLMSGIASKTGYNIELKEGKLIVQPLLMANYSAIKIFDYTNAAGIRIKSDMAHNVQLAPTLKIIGNVGNGWQPYASVGMVWNILHESDTKANGVKLPEMYTKPYVQYGLGLQKRWGDKFNAYGQAIVRNGGRQGIAFTAGFRWAFGKTQPKDKNEKNVNNKKFDKKVIKSVDDKS